MVYNFQYAYNISEIKQMPRYNPGVLNLSNISSTRLTPCMTPWCTAVTVVTPSPESTTIQCVLAPVSHAPDDIVR